LVKAFVIRWIKKNVPNKPVEVILLLSTAYGSFALIFEEDVRKVRATRQGIEREPPGERASALVYSHRGPGEIASGKPPRIKAGMCHGINRIRS